MTWRSSAIAAMQQKGRVALGLGVFWAGLAWSPPVAASQVAYRPMTLAELFVVPVTVVIVSWEKPATRQTSVPTCRGSAEKCPSFQVVAQQLKVREVVADPTHSLKVGETISVGDADAPTMFYITKQYYADGSSESPIFDRYSGVEGQPDRAIVVLQKMPFADYQWAFSVNGAVLPVGQLDEVKKLLAADKGQMPELPGVQE